MLVLTDLQLPRTRPPSARTGARLRYARLLQRGPRLLQQQHAGAGSIPSASRREISKNRASNSPTPGSAPSHLLWISPRSYGCCLQSKRSGGISLTASVPAASFSHISSNVRDCAHRPPLRRSQRGRSCKSAGRLMGSACDCLEVPLDLSCSAATAVRRADGCW